jgi:hypothetical protein
LDPKEERVGKRRSAFQVGDSVVVKAGVTDPDFGTDLDGWQGRIVDTHRSKKEGPLVTVRWDSVTLKEMPDSLIVQCEEQGLGWTEFTLLAGEVERAAPRDGAQDAERVAEGLARQHAWSYLGEQGRRIDQILAGVDPDDEMACLHAWKDHLAEKLACPFEAEVYEYQDRGPLQAGDRLQVTGISLVDDLYGLIVDVWRGRRKYAFPLCDLDVVEEKAPNHQLVQDYRVWFANR